MKKPGSPVITLVIPDYKRLKHLTGLPDFGTSKILYFQTTLLTRTACSWPDGYAR